MDQFNPLSRSSFSAATLLAGRPPYRQTDFLVDDEDNCFGMIGFDDLE
jgi:hypothetical protein